MNLIEHIKKVLKLMTLCREQDPYENFEKYSEAVQNNQEEYITGEKIQPYNYPSDKVKQNSLKLL